MSILLLGGEGFIGTHLLEVLAPIAKCFSVAHRMSPFSPEGRTFLSIDPYTQKINVEYSTVIQLIDNKVSPKDFKKAELQLLDNLELNTDKHVILFSSSVIYAQPESEYGQRKKTLEKVYADYCKQVGCKLTIIRLFNIYGSYQYPGKPGSLIANLLFGYIHHQPIAINDMNVQRDFIWAPDMARIIAGLIQDPQEGTFDVGSGTLTSIKEVIGIIEREVVHDSLLIHDNQTPEKITCPPARKRLQSSVGLTPLSGGLRQTYDFYIAHKDLFYG